MFCGHVTAAAAPAADLAMSNDASIAAAVLQHWALARQLLLSAIVRMSLQLVNSLMAALFVCGLQHLCRCSRWRTQVLLLRSICSATC
jgi:hypothetical protein